MQLRGQKDQSLMKRDQNLNPMKIKNIELGSKLPGIIAYPGPCREYPGQCREYPGQCREYPGQCREYPARNHPLNISKYLYLPELLYFSEIKGMSKYIEALQ